MRRWTDQQILAAIRLWTRLHGRKPAQSDWKESTRTHPHWMTVVQHFGSWTAGLHEAGVLTPSGHGIPRRPQ